MRRVRFLENLAFRKDALRKTHKIQSASFKGSLLVAKLKPVEEGGSLKVKRRVEESLVGAPWHKKFEETHGFLVKSRLDSKNNLVVTIGNSLDKSKPSFKEKNALRSLVVRNKLLHNQLANNARLKFALMRTAAGSRLEKLSATKLARLIERH